MGGGPLLAPKGEKKTRGPAVVQRNGLGTN